MKITRFEDIIAWQKAKKLTLLIYKQLERNNDFGYKNQLQRASASIMNNIAEGYERQTNKEFRQFLYISKGSCGEVRSMLHLAKELKTISDKEFKATFKLSEEISKILSGLIKTL